jgi:DNA-binding Lrp family transcriptional regulator
MTRFERHERDLERLAELLAERPRTALEIARTMKCSKPAAYARVAALRKRGHRVRAKSCRAGSRGPLSTQFSIGPVRKATATRSSVEPR